MNILWTILSSATLAATILAAGSAQGQVKGEDPFEVLAVDFLNDETRSVSIPVGSQLGLTSDTFFALLDGENIVIAEIYPFEILPTRFWSGPLTAEAFSRVRIGTRAVRIFPDQDKKRLLTDEYRARAAALRGAMVRRQKDRLEISLREIDEEILYLNNILRKLQRERLELRSKLQDEKQAVDGQLERVSDRLDAARNDLDDLEDERYELIEERNRLSARENPPQSRIQRLDERISRLNVEVGELRDEVQELREERRETREDAERRGILRIRANLDELALEESRVRIDLDERLSERDRIIRELERLKNRE